MRIAIAIFAAISLASCASRPPSAPAPVVTPDVAKVDAQVEQAIARLEAQAGSLKTVEERILFAQKVADEIDRITKNENADPSPTPRL